MHFLSLKFVPTSDTPKGERYVTLPGIIEVFSEQTTGVEEPTSPMLKTSSKFIRNGSLYIHSEGKVYNVLGLQVNK